MQTKIKEFLNQLGNGIDGRISRLAMVALLVMAMFAMATPAEARTQIYKYNHWVARYEGSDIPDGLRPYINAVELDMMYIKGPGYGARLYYSEAGRLAVVQEIYNTGQIPGPYLNQMMRWYVMTRPEWKIERSDVSVAMEIGLHAVWGRSEVDIEYYCSDLKSWEYPYNVPSVCYR